MMLHCWTRRSLAAVACCAIVAASMGTVVLLHAQQPATNAAAETALARMEAAYKTLPALHIKVRWSARYSGGMSADDFPLPGPDSLELRMERPNKFYLSATSKRDGKQSSYMVVSDGTTLTYWRSSTNSFIQKNAPATLSGIAGLLPDTVIGFAIDNSWEEESIAEWDLLADARAPSPTKAAAARGGADADGPGEAGRCAGQRPPPDTCRAGRRSRSSSATISTRSRTCCADLRRARAGSIRRTAATSRSRCAACTTCTPPSRPSAVTRSGSSRRAGRGREKAGRPHSCDKSLRESSPLTDKKPSTSWTAMAAAVVLSLQAAAATENPEPRPPSTLLRLLLRGRPLG